MNHYAITGREMRYIEQAAFDQGVPPVLVMENAARGVCDTLCRMLNDPRGKRVLFLCGPGNNGGDGLASARLFLQRGGLPSIYMPLSAQTAQAKDNFHYARYLGIPVLDTLPDAAAFDALVDALLGNGLSRAPEGILAQAIAWMNASKRPILSIDIPSGMSADDGMVYGDCVHASATVTFHAAKLGHFLTPALPWVGQLTIVDIGLRSDDTGIPYYTEDALPALLPPRPINAHKGSCGRVLVYGGSMGKAGAAAMCALGALKAGAGLVTIACPREIIPILQTLVPNAMCVPAEEAEHISFDVLAAGCGLGQTEEARAILCRLTQKARATVLDADALNLLSTHPFPLSPNTVLTPHPLEGARLLGCSLTDILSNPLECAKALSTKYQCTVVLKNAVSIIAQNEKLALNTTIAPALAKGGSGDALCGILAATLCENADLFESSRIACLRMGLAGQKAEKAFGNRGVLTPDMLAHLI